MIPVSVANLKRENIVLKAQLSMTTDETANLKGLIQEQNSITVPTCNETAHSLEFLSKEYDDFEIFRTSTKNELQHLNTKLAKLKVRVDAIGNAIGHLPDDITLLPRTECFVKMLFYSNLSSLLGIKRQYYY